MCVCVCLSVCQHSVNISLCSGLFLCTVMQYIGFVCVFFCLIGCFNLIVWTPTVFECLIIFICMCFLLLYLHLFSAIEHVPHGKAL